MLFGVTSMQICKNISFVFATICAAALFAGIPSAGQTPGRVTPSASTRIPRMPSGKPDLTGLWQVIEMPDWNIQDHSAMAGPFYQLGAEGAIPPGQGIVEGGEIPYKPAALEQKKQNYANRFKDDPEVKCYMAGVPRATYMPYPLQIIQSQKDILIAYEYATTNRLINMGKPQEPATDTWMGTSNGHWDKDTLVVDVTGFNGKAWFDRAGNYASDSLHVVERYTLMDANTLNYEATIEDPAVFTAPWKIDVILYRHREKDARLLEFKCVEFAEQLLYGDLVRKPSK
ncbi:MAG: hypothetical protein JOZ32_07130 [Bryobacterales bacterium]|nr:hypothetical protein [Bryobacterales bacterium]